MAVSAAHGLTFTDFKDRDLEEKPGFPCTYANKPIELPPTVSAVKKALDEALKKRRAING